MNSRTLCLSTLRLKPGMQLARPLLRPDGAVLMAEGTELSERELEALQQRGIEVVFVSVEDPRGEDEIARDLATAEERVGYIFRTPENATASGYGEARQSLQAAMLTHRRAGWLK